MTASANSKKQKDYTSSRQWAEERLELIKQLQDEYLDMYVANKKESTEMLKLLAKIQQLLEKKL